MNKAQEKEQIYLAIFVAVIAIVLFSAFSYFSEDNKPHDKYRNEDAQLAWNEKSKQGVQSRLKDGDSAKFRNVQFHLYIEDKAKLPITCGEVNSKNGFGGYSGFQRFIAAGSSQAYLEEEVKDFSSLWSKLCLYKEQDF